MRWPNAKRVLTWAGDDWNDPGCKTRRLVPTRRPHGGPGLPEPEAQPGAQGRGSGSRRSGDHMSTPTREPCPKCDVPRANDWDWQFGMPNASICWGGRFQPCCNPPVDWRARCLQAESALALMSAPLSPEALQAIAEDSES